MNNKAYSFSLWDGFLYDYLCHASIYLFLVPVAVIVPVLVSHGTPLESVVFFVLGWIIFLPQEYMTHKYILHLPAPKNSWQYRQMYSLHYGHHDLPLRSDLMYMPLWLVLPMLATNVTLYYFMTNGLYEVLALTSGLMSGYLFYEWTHLYCHLPYAPKTKLGKFIKKHHADHHFRDERQLYSVSLPALCFDYLAGTSGQDLTAACTADRYLGVAEDDPRLLESRTLLAAQSDGDLTFSKVWLRHRQAKGLQS